ncbi:nucleolin-like isoform X1 [Cotesia glomerata]|uniref:hydroxyisourate hydrolase n=2 Tax=Cotesia glomerata TaxID=32391 RepID=A0AAV7HYM3_COTGL|nr:nucleolin-like isoform X1 [Cotesia glomerata]KAH0535144.1 hypothetical protein KQX54_014125 [Cotesia glomerata]
MEKNKVSPKIIIDGHTVVCATEYIQEQPPRLTPTGKISHAKTRVYTQRYRKEWELMPDFKGWLTSVERQATRAYCTYCKKNLHAHRLSLLKHTCTMKHQRAALMHQTHMQKTGEGDVKYSPLFETITFETVKQNDDEENEDGNDNDDDDDEGNNDNEHEVEYNEDIEYIEEQSIDMDNEEQIDEKTQQIVELEDCDSQDFSLKIDKNEPCSKKIKLDPGERRDTLAEAMAHVHGEYSDDNDNQYEEDDCENIVHDEDNITEEEREINQVPITKILKNQQSGVVIKLRNKKITDDLNTNNDTDEMETKVYTTCQLNSSHLLNAAPHEIKKLVAIVSKGTKTTLFPGKTLTFTPSKLNSKLVLDKLKGSNNLSLVVSDPKTLTQRSPVSKISNNNDTNINNNNSTINTKSNSKGSTVTAGPSEKTKKPSNLVRNIKFKPPPISTHVMDTSKGIPVSGLQVSLYKLMDGRWTFLNESSTLSDGRCTDLVDDSKINLTAGRYKIHFDVDKYFTVRRIETMYPFIEIVFDVKNPTGNYHIPVLLSPHSYTTYRDSGGWPCWDDSH